MRKSKTRISGYFHLNIRNRLLLSFVTIVGLMGVGYGFALRQFHALRVDQQTLESAHEKYDAILNLHAHVSAFRNSLEDLTDTKHSLDFFADAADLRKRIVEDVNRAKYALRLSPSPEGDSFVLVSLEMVGSALPPEIDAMSDLAKAKDWTAIKLRSQSQVKQMSYLTSSLVDKVASEVAGDEARVFRASAMAEKHILMGLATAGIMTLLVATILGIIVTRSITRPLALLDKSAQALSRGEFGWQVAVEGKDELADLANAFNYTTRQLRDLYEDLQKNEARFRSLIEHSSDFIFVLDPRGIIRYVSPSSERVLGVKSEDLIGEEIFVLIHPDDLGIARKALSTEAPTVLRMFEFRYRYPEQQERLIEAVSTNLTDNPAVSGIVVNARDITDRKKAEDALQQAQAELAHVARSASMGELTASIAHEVSQPITSMVANATAGLRWLAAEPPNMERCREALLRVTRDGDRAGAIVTRIRAFFKKSPSRKDLLNINELIVDVIALLGSELRASEIALEMQLADGLPLIFGDRVQLQQVVLNLVVNAIEAMREKDQPRLLVLKSTQDERRGVSVSVGDSGPGFQPTNVESLFEAFYTTKPKGMGMGLAISKSIIKAHGGRLTGFKNQGAGATFEFVLPVQDVEGDYQAIGPIAHQTS